MREIRTEDLQSWSITPLVVRRVLVGILGTRDSIEEENPSLLPHEAVAIVIYVWLRDEQRKTLDMLGWAVRLALKDLREKIDETWTRAFDGGEDVPLADLRVGLINDYWLTWSGQDRQLNLAAGELGEIPKPIFTTSMLHITPIILEMVKSVKQHQAEACVD